MKYGGGRTKKLKQRSIQYLFPATFTR